jgi:hypothetical protein
MFKSFIRTAATFGLAATIGVPNGVAAENGLHFGLEIRPVEIQLFPDYLQQISNVPASARTVPIHSGDPGAGTLVSIPGTSVRPGSYIPFAISAAPEIGYGRFTFRAGAGFSPAAIAPQAQKASAGSTQEYNYIQGGTSRGYGAALVYYAGLVRPANTPGLFGELEIRAAGGFSAIFGYQRSVQNVEIQQGWDRYDALEAYQSLGIVSKLVYQL